MMNNKIHQLPQPGAATAKSACSKEVQTSQELHVETIEEVCSVMPFQEVPDDELGSCFISNREIKEIQLEAIHYKKACSDILNDYDKLESIVKELQIKENNTLKSDQELTSKLKSLTKFVIQLDEFYKDILKIEEDENSDLCTIVDYFVENSKHFKYKPDQNCDRCSLPTKHKLQHCPAYKQQCSKCRKDHHIAIACKVPDDQNCVFTPYLKYTQEIKDIIQEFKHVEFYPFDVLSSRALASQDGGIFCVTMESYQNYLDLDDEEYID